MTSNTDATVSVACRLMNNLCIRDRIGDIVVVEGTPQRSGTIVLIAQEHGETTSHIKLKDGGRIIGAVLRHGSWHEWNRNFALPGDPGANVKLAHEYFPSQL